MEEGQTIYRWEMGESLLKHRHSGLVVKASKIVTPHFNLHEEKVLLIHQEIHDLPEEKRQLFRKYIQTVRSLDPKLEEKERERIEKHCKEENLRGEELAERMTVAKLMAKSRGSRVIAWEDYEETVSLFKDRSEEKV